MTQQISPLARVAVAAVALLVASLTAAAQSLCAKGEIDYFSCRLPSQRTISVCGVVHDEPTAQDWLQYRVGFHRRLEMAWPRERSGSLDKFEGNVFGRYSVSDLRFQIGDATYGIELSRGGEDNGAGALTRRTAGEHLSRDGRPDVVRQCVRPDVARYARGFEELNARLSNQRSAAGPQ